MPRTPGARPAVLMPRAPDADNCRNVGARLAARAGPQPEGRVMEQLQIEQIATAELDPGERLVWSGSPRPAALALQAIPATLFGIPFAGFAVFWMYGAWTATTRGGHLSGPWLL